MLLRFSSPILGIGGASPKRLNFSRLNDTEAIRTEVPFTEEEVHVALADLNGDKAPGPDGFTAAFWQFSWDVVKSDIMGLSRDFHEHGRALSEVLTQPLWF